MTDFWNSGLWPSHTVEVDTTDIAEYRSALNGCFGGSDSCGDRGFTKLGTSGGFCLIKRLAEKNDDNK